MKALGNRHEQSSRRAERSPGRAAGRRREGWASFYAAERLKCRASR